ncbi:hypothetical protein BN168_610041 [Clostridioides difficile CD002]|nr:hypothetical protein BN168_610041 [Clostridioides difficile CD002]
MIIIIIPPINIIKSLFSLKNILNTLTDEPNIKNVVEIPRAKNTVFLNRELPIKLVFPSFRFSTLLFDNILK